MSGLVFTSGLVVPLPPGPTWHRVLLTRKYQFYGPVFGGYMRTRLLANQNAPSRSRDLFGPIGERRHGHVTQGYVMAREFPIVYRLWMGSVSGEC